MKGEQSEWAAVVMAVIDAWDPGAKDKIAYKSPEQISALIQKLVVIARDAAYEACHEPTP